LSSRRRHTGYWRDWSSDVCSSDLELLVGGCSPQALARAGRLADGYIASGASPDQALAAFTKAEESWNASDRAGTFRFLVMQTFALGPRAQEAGEAHVRSFYGSSGAMQMVLDAFLRTPEQVRDALRAHADVGVDEFTDIARISGSPEFHRFSFVHALNIRSTARRVADLLGKPVAELRLVVAHLGAGFSIAAVDRGRLIDNSNRMECSPFTPERSGGLPPITLIEACYSGKWTKAELLQKLYGQGGVFAYLGTRDMREVEHRIETGDDNAALIYDAMLYQVAKAAGAMASTMDFNIDGIVLTGGLANSKKLTDRLTSKMENLAPVFVFAGSNENQALAEAVVTALEPGGKIMDWPIPAHATSRYPARP